MAIYIGIQKIFECDGIHFYKVSNDRCDPFFIKIIAGSNKIYFYKDQDCLDLLGCIDFANKEGLIQVDGLPSGVVGRVAVKVYRALQNKDFPEILSIES